MGLLSWLGIGKNKEQETQVKEAHVLAEVGDEPSSGMEIVVYSTSDATRCASARDILERNNFTFNDKRVDEDLSTKAWLQRTTGDDNLPKVFIGIKCYGGFEDIQSMIMDGTFQDAVDGKLDTSGDDEIDLLKETMTSAAMSDLFKRGEILTINEGGSETDVWAEPFANTPVIYYEGAPEPMDEILTVASRILERVASGEIEIEWKEED